MDRFNTRKPLGDYTDTNVRGYYLRKRIQDALETDNTGLKSRIQKALVVNNSNVGSLRNQLEADYTGQNKQLRNLLLMSVGLIIGFGYLAFTMAKKKKIEDEGSSLSLSEFLLGEHVVNEDGKFELSKLFNMRFLKAFGIGATSSFIFGFIDNAGLFQGMASMDPFLPGGSLTKAAFGNTFSDGLGAFIGTFIGYMIITITGMKDTTPLLSEVVGVVAGCLFAIPVMARLTGKS